MVSFSGKSWIGRWQAVCEAPRGSKKPLNRLTYDTEDPLRLSGIYRAFTMACICFGAKGIANIPPSLSPNTQRSFYLLMCAGLCFPSVLQGRLAAEMPPNDVGCESCIVTVKGSRMGKGPFYQFVSSFSVSL